MALDATIKYVNAATGVNTNGGGYRGQGNLAAPPAPGVDEVADGGAVAANTYYVVITYVGQDGEGPRSKETVFVSSGATSLCVESPASDNPYATGFSVYVGTVSNGPYFRQSAGNVLGVVKKIAATPPTSGTQPVGVNRSFQDSPQVAIDNATITATTPGANSNVLTFGGYVPTADDVGNLVQILSGTNVTPGFYEVTAWTATTWTLTGNQNLTTAAGAGSAIKGNMGGWLLTLPGGTAGAFPGTIDDGLNILLNHLRDNGFVDEADWFSRILGTAVPAGK